MDPANAPASALIAAASPGSVVAIVGEEEYTVTVIRDDPATGWFRLWNRGCKVDDRLYLKVGTVTVKELEHIQHAKSCWCSITGARFCLFTIQARNVDAAFRAKRNAAVFLKLGKEV